MRTSIYRLNPMPKLWDEWIYLESELYCDRRNNPHVGSSQYGCHLLGGSPKVGPSSCSEPGLVGNKYKEQTY